MKPSRAANSHAAATTPSRLSFPFRCNRVNTFGCASPTPARCFPTPAADCSTWERAEPGIPTAVSPWPITISPFAFRSPGLSLPPASACRWSGRAEIFSGAGSARGLSLSLDSISANMCAAPQRLTTSWSTPTPLAAPNRSARPRAPLTPRRNCCRPMLPARSSPCPCLRRCRIP